MAPAKSAQFAVLGIAVPILLLAFSGAPGAGNSGVPGEESCASCHNGPPEPGSVTLTFPGTATYSPGVRQHLAVTIADPAQRRWGFQLTARLASSPMTQAGSFTPAADGYTQLVCTQSNFHSQVFGAACATNGLPLQYIEQTQAGTRLNVKSPVTYEFDWTPPSAAAGNLVFYLAAVSANGDNSQRGDHCFTARYTITPPDAPPPPPAVTSVVNAASFQADVSAGSWLTIFGSDLASSTRAWTTADFTGAALPTLLDGVGVKLNGKSAYVAFISPAQINVQAPADASLGSVAVEVTNNCVTGTAGSARLEVASPAFFVWNGRYAVATHTDFSLAAPAVAPGVVPPASPVAAVVAPVTVTIGDLSATVVGAALTPGNAGLYQIAVQLPASLGDGDQPLVAQTAGMQSPIGTLLGVKR